MSNKYNTLRKNTMIFAVGNIGSSLISFLLIPLFTNYLTTAEYGEIDFISITITLLTPVITLNLIEALVRFGVDRNYNNKIVISTIIFILIPIDLIALSIVCLLVITGVAGKILFFYWLIFFVISTYQILQQYTRAIEKLKIYAACDILYTLIFSAMNIILIAQLRMGVKGYFISYIGSYTIVCIFVVATTKLYKDIKISLYETKYLKEFIIYSAPLIPNSLSWWVITVSDRYFIRIFSGYSQLGLYSVSNKIPHILNTFNKLFFKAWQISSVKELGKEDTEEFYEKVFGYLSKIMFSIGIVILLSINVIFYIMIGEEFKDAINFVPILVLAAIFYTFASFVGTIYTAHKKSKNILTSTILSAAINIIINIIFIPKFGTIVACISTLLSYVTLFIHRCFDSRKFMKVKINYSDLVISTGIFIIMVVNISFFKLSSKAVFINIVMAAVYIGYNFKDLTILKKYLLLKAS